MIVVGIDPSLTCTGIAVVSEFGMLRTDRARTAKPEQDSLGDRRRRIRLALIRILAALPADVDLFVVERPSERSQPGKHNERVALYWFLVDQLLARGPVVEVGSKTRAMYATGNGNADKGPVKDAMRAVYPAAAIPDDNVADAAALASMGARYLGIPTDGDLDKQHLRAMDAVSWPTTRRATS